MNELVDLEELLVSVSVPRLLAAKLARPVGWLSGLSEINSLYSEFLSEISDPDDDPAFFMKALRSLQVQFEVDAEDYEHIPREGPLLVVANHPFGGIDGMVLGALLKSVRPDAMLMGNYLLSKIDGIRGSIIEVDPFDREISAGSNLSGVRQALAHLKAGHALGVFPAGEVSSYNFSSRSVMDPQWSSHVTGLALKTNATLLPVYFKGCNSLFFQTMGLIHPKMRTLLLAREFCRMKGRRVGLRVGQPILPDRLKRFENKSAATDYLRLKTYSLKEISPKRKSKLRFPFRSSSTSAQVEPLASPQIKQHLAEEVASLPTAHCLVKQGDFHVYFAHARQIPLLLHEIGRLREETFRAVQEGTGQARDLDEYDEYYVHLFLWNHSLDEIVGAYRIGLADEIVAQYGIKGLYTSTLFKFRPAFLEKLGPCLELGRSFICQKYQKKNASLSLIWRGIGEFVAKNPRYRILIGPVSITDAYHSISKNLMVHFFREHTFDDEMSQMVSARKPPKSKSKLEGSSLKNIAESITSVDSVSAIVSGFEDDKKGIPILLRHYLKLNGVLLSFNVDPAFSDVIDGLILVDLCKAEARLLERYFGKECYAKIANFHAKQGREDSAP